MTVLELALLGFAGLAAGVLNAVAGGGTFLTLPALIYAGVPPVIANATSTLAVLPGYVSSAWAFRDDLPAEGTLSTRTIIVIASIGSALGAGLLILTPGDAFLWIVPWLLLTATLLFAAGPMLTQHIQAGAPDGVGSWISGLAIFAVSIYGGYFNGGLGILLLAVFSVLGFTNLHGMNGLKNILAAVLSLISVGAFSLAGLIAWEQAILMAICATLGGYAGARVSRKIVRTDLLRAFVTLVGVGMTVAFFVR
ncbi:sulfite exporter TauE/SafE family protein [Ahrensia marina]|uniref:sulfite exporter TauE/SafE family protein n=1 Tax=Ahrensia marina TaxID=1514904 RepID=UPI0035D0150F